MTLADPPHAVAGVEFDFDDAGDGVAIAHLAFNLDLPATDDLVAALAASAALAPMVLDVSDVTLVDPGAVIKLVDAMVAASGDAETCCVVARRASGRRLLRQWGIDSIVCLFASVGDALQARRHAGDGYGRGWALPTT